MRGRKAEAMVLQASVSNELRGAKGRISDGGANSYLGNSDPRDPRQRQSACMARHLAIFPHPHFSHDYVTLSFHRCLSLPDSRPEPPSTQFSQ